MNANSPHTQEILQESMDWMDRLYDPGTRLLWHPGDPDHPSAVLKPSHMVRDSVYYALGLLLRAAPCDIQRADHVLNAILDYQLDEPGAVYHGTFLRYPEEARPGPGAREWLDYDPNWRDFIGTGFALAMIHFEQQLSPALVRRIDHSLRLAVEGTLERKVRPGYTNIALMDAYLLYYCGERLGVEAWKQAGETLGKQVYDLFDENGAFEEYNSPTYYGTDLYALRLWNTFSSSALLAHLGAEMETRLWEDIARYYHAGLGNISGPWDRSYGMDMRRYAALLGLWIWAGTGRALAPFPDTSRPFGHCADLCFGMCAAITGASIPPGAMRHFLAFQSPRLVEQTIESNPRRAASAWLDENYMLGGEWTSRSKEGYDQFHPFTLHWQTPEGPTGWARLRHENPVDVQVAPGSASIEGSGGLVFELYAPGTQPSGLKPESWHLNGLPVQVETDASSFKARDLEEGYFEIRYWRAGEIRLRLEIQRE